ncbi:MAG: membrane protein of unknown function [Promethearchaeota archaeon]|nr:MAG: membrane protein of unknown function [Candidatus Lokiarchaeota archaeon]
MIKPKIQNILISSASLIVGILLSLLPNDNWLSAAGVRFGHSLLIGGVLFIVAFIIGLVRNNKYETSIEQLFASETGTLIVEPWRIKKEGSRIIIRLDRPFYYFVILIVVLLGILLYYLLLPVDLAIRDSGIDLPITPAFILGVFTLFLALGVYFLISTLRRNERVIIQKNSPSILFLRKEGEERSGKSDLNDSIIIPMDNLKQSEINLDIYNQLLVPSDGIEGDDDFIERKTKSSGGKTLMIIQDRDEEFIKTLKKELLVFLGLINE